jgi:polyisoprenoid-binding protein YceI
MMWRVLSLALATLTLTVAAFSQTTAPNSAPSERVLTITEDSRIDWVGRKVTGHHDGGFETFSGTVRMEGDDPSSMTIRVEIDITSLWADNPNLRDHLLTADFFDAENHPAAVFESDAVLPYGDQWMITGDLVLRGVTGRASLPVTLEDSGDRVRLTGGFTLMRFDFGIALPGRPGDLIANEVSVSFDVVAEMD